MTSKISFFKLVRDEQKKLTWMTALMGLVFGLLIPFRVLVVMALNNSQYTGAESGRIGSLTGAFWNQIGFGHFENTFFILCAGAFCALCAFGYLHSPVKLDFFHSLAVKRETLFGAKAIGSILTFVIPYVISQLLGLLAGLPYGVDVKTGAAEVLAASGQGILFFLASYGGTLLALMLTGKTLTTVFAAGVMAGYIPLLYLLMIVMQELFLYTSLSGEDMIEAGILWYSSPWAICIAQNMGKLGTGKEGITGLWPEQSGTCTILLMVICLFLLSLLIYRRRKTERAGSALAFRHTEMPVKMALVIPSAVTAGLVGYEIFMSVIWAFIFIILFGALLCMIIEFIYRWDIRQVLVHKGQMMTAVLAALLIFCGFRYDLSGYNTYLPEKDEIASMAVCDLDLAVGYLEEETWNTNTRRFLDRLETDQFDRIYELAENGVENAAATNGFGAYTYDEYCWYAGVKFHLKNGKEIYRRYYVKEELLSECMDEMWENEEVRRRTFPILDMDPEKISYACMYYNFGYGMAETDSGESDTWEDEEAYAEYATETYENNYFEFTTRSEIVSLLEAYREDLAQVTYQDCMYRGGSVQFQIDEKNDCWVSYPLGDKWTKTLALCRKQAEKYQITE